MGYEGNTVRAVAIRLAQLGRYTCTDNMQEVNVYSKSSGWI